MNLTQAIKKFDLYLGGKSPLTRKTYRNALARLVEFKGDIPVAELTVDDVPALASWLYEERRLARSTVNTYLSITSRFFRFLMLRKYADIGAEEYLLLQEELKELKGNRSTRKVPRLPEEDAVQETLEVAMATDDDDTRLHLLHLRNAALLATLESTGCRLAEVANLKRGDLIPGRMAARVTGKGDKSRTVFFSEQAWRAVEQYLEARDKAALVPQGPEPLMGRHDKVAHGQGVLLGVSTNALGDALRGLCQKAGVDRVKAHSLRHRRATQFLRKTHDLDLTSRLLGHASVSTTQIYTHLTDEDVEAAVRGEGE